MDDPERDQLLERIERLERFLAGGQDGLDVYARGFVKLRAELDAVRALVPSVEATAKPTPVPAAAAEPTPPAPRAVVERPPVTPVTREAPARPAQPKPPPRPATPPAPPRRTAGELARDWDLVGARGFAIVGGAVMALGIGFFFVLATNRGWIGEEMRVALGASASALVFTAGLRRGSAAIRYGGLALFGLSLAKIFLYDLSSLSSVARAFSFIFVGGLLLAGGFFLQRLSDRLGHPRAS